MHSYVRLLLPTVLFAAQIGCSLQYTQAAPNDTYVNINGWQHKGWALRSAGRYAEAEASQKKALELVQKAPQYANMEGNIYSDIMEALEYQNKYAEALTYGDNAIRNAKISPLTKDYVNFHRAKSYVALKKYSEAAILLDQLIKHSQSDVLTKNHNSLYGLDIAQAQKLLADCYAEEKRDALAETNYKAAIALPELYVPRNSNLRLPALRAYLNFLQKHNRSKDAQRIAARIKDMELHPTELHACGTSSLRAQAWLNWQPKDP
jgi:tetratricopeptide (TPR) repeat protein